MQRDAEVAAQQNALAESKAQDTLMRERLELQEQARQDLEANIEERTFELQVTLRELEEKNRELEQLNMEDALPKTKNRRYFDKKLLMDIRRSRREQTPLAIIMLDIDHFKAINDTYGHLTGDQTIQAAADVIKQHLKRPLDEVARYGGEEFVVLLPNTPLEGALEIAEQIRKAAQNTDIIVAGTTIKFTLSAGVYSAIAEDINNPSFFTDYADKALYHAKQTGRNRVVSYPLPD
jgi:diguanylate cyclase (GGDEF)-like protein